MRKQKILALSLVVLLNLFAFYLTLAWTEPSSAPPGGNVPELLNTSSTSQTKSGELKVANLYLDAGSGEGSIINADYIQGYDDLHLVSNDSSSSHETAIYLGTSTYNAKKIAFYIDDEEKMILDSNGNLGIGTTPLSYKLDVNGQINGTELCINGDCKSSWPSGGGGIQGSISAGQVAFGTGTDTIGGDDNFYWDNTNKVLNVSGTVSCSKLNTNEIDPIYTIEGTNYATYGHSIIGLKEEVVGKVEVSNYYKDGIYSFTIDFDNQKKGSDLWLFRRITDFGENWGDLIVSLTPEGKANVWYEIKPNSNQIIIFANNLIKVSYRLIAPRFDWKERDTNVATDQDSEGMLVK